MAAKLYVNLAFRERPGRRTAHLKHYATEKQTTDPEKLRPGRRWPRARQAVAGAIVLARSVAVADGRPVLRGRNPESLRHHGGSGRQLGPARATLVVVDQPEANFELRPGASHRRIRGHLALQLMGPLPGNS